MTSRRRPTPTPFLALGLANTLALAFAAGAAHSQDVSNSGTVTDTTDLTLPSVKVEVCDAAGGGVTFADGTGQYWISGAMPGTYERTFSLPGSIFSAPALVVEIAVGDIADLMSV